MEYVIIRNSESSRFFDVIKADFESDEYSYVNKNLTFEDAQEVLGIVKFGNMLDEAKE